ncbi:MAG: LD-carboxypeptidase [Tissierellia bacterium]|nr:LD-carboxypeptidase [Tissierellia bacterium]
MFKLSKGDKVAIVSLSSGVLGQSSCSHQLELGAKRIRSFGLEPVYMKNALKGIEYIKSNPKARAEDLIQAFKDKTINAVFCAIGGIDTYRIAPYIFDNPEAISTIKNNPKLFMGYSDTTINHFMLRKLGINTIYGLSYLPDFSELGEEMLPYTKSAFEQLFREEPFRFGPSDTWYEERTDFSAKALNTPRIAHKETRGYELLQGKPQFKGHLLGGCIDSIYELLTGYRFEDEKTINDKYQLFPATEDFNGAILFLETSEEKPSPEYIENTLNILIARGVLDVINGVIIGKPQDEIMYDEYKEVYKRVLKTYPISVVYNMNFGHAHPKMIMPYGTMAYIDTDKQEIIMERP